MLDIGCGVGRWLENLNQDIQFYTGVDYSKPFIDYLESKYKNPNYKFYNLSATELTNEILSQKYDLVISTGLMMYINDEELQKLIDAIGSLKPFPKLIYFQESVSVMENRLTLNNFDSESLNSSYSAIYRTQKEYEAIFSSLNCKILETNLLLDSDSGAQEETNVRYWVLACGNYLR